METMYSNQNNPKTKKMRSIKLFIAGCITLLLPALLFAQNRIVTGTVTGKDNASVSGATIAVQNTSIAVAADVNGKFTLTAPQDATLVVSSSGLITLKC